MEDLEHALIGEQALELRRLVVPAKLHELGLPVAARQLHEAKPVAMGVEPERFGIDGDGVAEDAARGQVFSMQLDRHRRGLIGRGSCGLVRRPAAGRGAIADLDRGSGAQEKTRTSTPFRALAPEASASTSSATWA